MIKGVFIINNNGKARLVKCYERMSEEQQAGCVREIYSLLSKRSDSVCNFLEGGSLTAFGKDTKLIYRHFATLYFVFAVDNAESELGILDLIQVFVEVLDKCFENVCELDIIFNSDKVRRAWRVGRRWRGAGAARGRAMRKHGGGPGCAEPWTCCLPAHAPMICPPASSLPFNRCTTSSTRL